MGISNYMCMCRPEYLSGEDIKKLFSCIHLPLCVPHSNNGTMIWYTRLLIQDAHTVTILPILKLEKPALCHL